MLSELLELDGQILLWIQEYLRVPVLNIFFSNFTKLGDAGMIWIILGVALLVSKKTRQAGWLVLFSLLGSLIVNNIILKNLVARTRPYEVIDGLSILIERQKDLSFPSGHTGSSFAAAVVLAAALWNGTGIPRRRGWSIFLIAMAFLIAFSRLYVGVHYPTDVLAGMATGTLIAAVVYTAYRKMMKKARENTGQKETGHGTDSDH